MSKFVVNVFLIVIVVFHALFGLIGREETARVIFLNVGQGDSALVQLNGFNILVDGGDGDQVVHHISPYLDFNVRLIDLVILSHPHQDHMNGLLDVLEKYSVNNIAINPVCYRSENYKKLLKYKDKFIFPKQGDEVKVGDSTISFLTPEIHSEGNCNKIGSEGIFRPTHDNLNDDSLSFTLNYLNYSVLFPGDGEEEFEKGLIQSGLLKDVNLLKAGHHCSNTSSSIEFLNIIKPELIICSSAEKNRYNHPGKITIDNFNMLELKYLFTWKEGDIVVDLK